MLIKTTLFARFSLARRAFFLAGFLLAMITASRAAVTAFSSGVLTISLNAANEAVTLSNNGTTITVSSTAAITGAGSTYATGSVTGIVINDPGNLAGQSLTFLTGTAYSLSGGLAISGVETVVLNNAVTGLLPTLGTYPTTSLMAGQNAVITPSVAPTNATSIVAYANPSIPTVVVNFTGVLAVNPTTGVLTVTKALQAGVYAVTVKAFNGAVSTTTAFTLTVTNPTCSQGTFSGTTEVAVGTNPYSVAVGDFNGDGRQDFAAANQFSNTVSIRLGDGLGGFSGTTDVAVGTFPFSVAVGDFNGDGRQDFAAANNNSNTVSIRLGDGLGGFSGTTGRSGGTISHSV